MLGPGTQRVEGNEATDDFVKGSGTEHLLRNRATIPKGSELRPPDQKTTEKQSQASNGWISNYAGRERRYRLPKGNKISPGLWKENKELAGRSFQLPGDAVTGA